MSILAAQIVVIGKAPVPGRVKTRLVDDLKTQLPGRLKSPLSARLNR